MVKKAIITGVTGQDGSYLAELLLKKGYEVHGSVRRSSLNNPAKLTNIRLFANSIKIHPLSIDDQAEVDKIIREIKPDECYHLAGSSFVSYSFEDEQAIMAVNFNSTLFLLSSIKKNVPKCRFYFAGSSEMFGNAEETPQNERTRFNPHSAYGISKISSYFCVKNYREREKIYACTGITYNHESSRRDFSFVTRKISHGVARIFLGLADRIEVGNLDTIRDWGYAPEYVKAAWLMLNSKTGPKDYVIATGRGHTVREFIDVAFSSVGLSAEKYVKFNKDFFRPSERIPLIGDSSEIQKDLGWKAKKGFKEICEMMVKNDIALLKKENL